MSGVGEIGGAGVLAAAAVGLVTGSFLNLCADRLPRGESLLWPRSHCEGCGRSLGVWDLLPVLSFVLSRGRCRYCGRALPWRYPAVEAATALLFALLALKYGLAPAGAHLALFAALLVLIFVLDLEGGYIPDLLTLPGMALGVGGGGAVALLTSGAAGVLPAVKGALLGLLAGGGSLFCLRLASRGGVGWGDVKLLGMIGAFLGWPGALLVLFGAALAGSLVGLAGIAAGRLRWRDPLPFGPFLSTAALLFVLL
ncbi:MAG: prepilin peptidase [Bacillota bacterium]|nr:prepilin peptidase [Bacillota bacterium]